MWAYSDWQNYGLENLTFRHREPRCHASRPGQQSRSEPSVKAEGKRGFSVTHSALYSVYRRRLDRRGQRRDAGRPAHSPGPPRRAHAAGQGPRSVHLPGPRPDGELRRPQARIRHGLLPQHRARADDAVRQADGMRQPRRRPLGRPLRQGITHPDGPGRRRQPASLGPALYRRGDDPHRIHR